jgi:hypothetical protein
VDRAGHPAAGAELGVRGVHDRVHAVLGSDVAANQLDGQVCTISGHGVA